MLGAIILISITQLLLALFVFLKRRDSLTNVLFALLSVSMMCWAVFNYIAIPLLDTPNIIYIVRLILFFVVIQNTLYCLFIRTFPDTTWKYSRKWLAIYLLFSALVACVTLSPYVFTAVTIENGLPHSEAGPAMLLFVVHATFSIATIFITLHKKKKNTHGALKNQLKFLQLATVLVLVIVPITNFVITPVFRTTLFIVLGPFYTLLFAALIAYTIIAQKLFDIRAAVARSVAYVLLTGTLALAYSVTLFGFINVVFSGPHNELLRQVLSVILVFPLALGFQPIKRFFDRLTNKLFYRDSYDTQVVLSQLGKIIVAEIDLHKILLGTRTILTEALKSSFVEFIFFKKNDSILQYSTNNELKQDLVKIVVALKHQKKTAFTTDNASDENIIKGTLAPHDVAISLQLKTQEEVVGYILFGNKQSGDIYSNQDIKLLRIIANELAVAIQNALRFEEIQNFAKTLEGKVEEATRDLRRANEKLKQLDQTKDDFISMASHQLRTPLTSVKGYVSMVLEGDTGKITAKQREMLDQAFISSQRMVYLISDLLNVSRLRTGKFVIEAKPTNLAEVVDGEIKQLIETAKGRDLELTYQKPKSFPTLMLDDTKIRQVIMNFADNAIYYTPSGGHIQVALEDKGESIEFTVTDDGIGVPKREQHHLFNKFYRAGNAKKARPDGTGLGLFMAKKVIVAQGGTIIFRSQEGKGSTFGFSFHKKPLLPENFKGVMSSETPPHK